MCLWIRDRAGHMPHDTSQVTNDRTRAAEHIQQVAYNRTLARTQICITQIYHKQDMYHRTRRIGNIEQDSYSETYSRAHTTRHTIIGHIQQKTVCKMHTYRTHMIRYTP